MKLTIHWSFMTRGVRVLIKLIIDCLLSVINQEKTIHNIGEFDKSKLKHTETEVKNPLPDKEGEIVFNLLRFILM